MTPRGSTGNRRLGVRIPAMLGMVLFAFFFSMVAAEALGLIGSGSEGSPGDPLPSPEALIGASQPGETVHVVGSLAVLALGLSGLIALIVRPEHSTSAYHVLAAMGAVLLTLPLVGNPDNYGGQAGWIDPVFLVPVVFALAAGVAARPWRHWRAPGALRLRFLALAAIAAVPGAWYGVDQALMQRNTFPPAADPHHNAHWGVMAVFAFMIILTMAAAVLPSRGWRLGPLVAGLAALAGGIAALIAPSSASAVESIWAVAAIVWGSAGVALSFVPRHRAVPESTGSAGG